MKRIASLVVVAALVGVGAWGYFYAQSRGSVPKYRTARVERGPLTAAVSSTGNLNAVITVQVGSQVSGQIKELFVDFNSVVKRGQVIARIDPQIFEAQVNQAKADLETAKAAVLNQTATVEKARADVETARAALAQGKAQTAKADAATVDARRIADRNSELFRRELIAQADRDTAGANYDQATAQSQASRANEKALAAAIQAAEAQLRVQEAALKSARAQVDQKQAALTQAQANLNYTTIRAPVDGVVVSRAVDVGQTVAASLQAPTLFTIAQDLTKMQVEVSVDEADIGRIKLEDHATFTVDAFPGQTFNGVVTQIRKAAQIIQNVVTYTVIVAVNNPGGTLLPGMTANVKMIVAEKPSVLKVPNAALRFRPAGADAGPGPTVGGPAAGSDSGQGRRQGQGGGGRPSGEQMREAGRVWLVEGDKPKAVAVTLGISDGSSTEVLRGDLKEGQEVVIGLASAQNRGSSTGGGSPRLRL
jgi:HlyD family secretion protein